MKKTTKMKMCAIALSAILALSAGCAPEKNNSEISNSSTATPAISNEQSFDEPVVEYTIEDQTPVVPQSKIFDIGEHCIQKHVYFYDGSWTSLEKERKDYLSQIQIPKGYQLMDSENYIEDWDYGSQTTARDYYFVNIVPVEVTSDKLDESGQYIFDQFGTPIENNQVLSKTQD